MMTELKKSPVVFDETTHQYFLGEKELSGVTSTLIRRAFPDKYKDIDPEVLARAAEKGHELHTAIEFYDEFGGEPSKAGDDRIALYADMKKEYGLSTIANEYLVSDEQHYASSIDIVMQDGDGGICLVDTKTTYNLDKQSTGLQLSIYKRFFEQQNPDIKVAHIYALWLPNKDHSICELHELAVVPEETIDALIDADLANEPFQFELIPDEWATLEKEYTLWSMNKDIADKNIDRIKQRMMDIMQTGNLSSVKTEDYTVSFMPAKKTKRFDSTTFKKEHKDMYDTYMKESETAAQIRITSKKEK